MPPQNQPVPPGDAFQSRAAAGHSVNLFIILIVALLIVIVVGVVAYKFYAPHTAGTRFSLIENGAVTWYSVSGSRVTSAQGPAGFDTSRPQITEAAAALMTKQTPVLAGTAVGLVGNNGGYVQAYDDGIAKQSLTSSPAQNWVAFSQGASTSPQIMLYQFNIPAAHALSMVGYGFGPVFSGTDILAFDGLGLFRTGMDGVHRELLADAPGLTPSTAAIAPDGSVAAFKDSDGGVEVVSISPWSNSVVEIGTTSPPTDAVGFVSSSEFVVQAGSSFTFYSVASSTLTKLTTASL